MFTFLKNNFSGRIGRLHLLGGLIFWSGVYFITVCIFMVLSINSTNGNVSPALVTMIVFAAIIYLWFIIGLHSRRLHDIDLSAWWLFLGLVPFVNILFGLYTLIAPGNHSENKYGKPNPKGTKFFKVIFNTK